MDDASPAAGFSDVEALERVTRLNDLLERLEGLSGTTVDIAMEAIELLTDVYGVALGRIVAMLAAGGADIRTLADDELVGQLMTLHGLHPDPVERRITAALDDARQELRGRADVELTQIDDGVARLKITAAGCHSTAGAMAATISDIVLAAAPELVDVDATTARPPAEPPLISADSLLRRPVSR